MLIKNRSFTREEPERDATTEVFKLAQNILSVGKIKEKIEHLLRGIG